MNYSFDEITQAAEAMQAEFDSTADVAQVLKSKALKGLYAMIPQQKPEDRPKFGQEVNQLKAHFEQKVNEAHGRAAESQLTQIDVTAPFDENTSLDEVALLPASEGSLHPLTTELNRVLSIFESMGFSAIESRQLDDDYHMFGSLNFPEDHPARDDYDTFVTDEGLIAPAHTSTMQNRVLIENKSALENGDKIQVVVPGRCFRNEDIDARHEHTLHQVEGVMVGEGINVGNLIATLKTFLEAYYGKSLDVKTQPAYFPFVEPGFEFSMSCPFCDKQGCKVCSHEGWIEILGCGMIHPNVLRAAEIDPEKYTGFAWGFGLDRLVMMQHNIDDIRWFQSGKIEFLEQFS
jgi:phenylalanyl-tRNA synthetase alpha chain